MDLKPIVTEADHRDALVEIERLWGADPQSADGAKLDALATLVEAYEEKVWPVEASDPIATLEAHMAWNSYTQADLATLFGSRSRASEVLARKRALTLSMVHKLEAEWGIPATLLVKPYALRAA